MLVNIEKSKLLLSSPAFSFFGRVPVQTELNLSLLSKALAAFWPDLTSGDRFECSAHNYSLRLSCFTKAACLVYS